MGNMTLPEFFQNVDRTHRDMRKAGVVNVYYMHDTLTPHNVRYTREDVPVRDVPRVGQVEELPYAGYMGEDARWLVVRDEWHEGPGVTLYCCDAPPSASPRVEATRYEVNAFPDGKSSHARHYTVKAERTADGMWAVLHLGYVLGQDGSWEPGDPASEPTSEWLASHRFDLDTALALANQHAVLVEVGGVTADQKWALLTPGKPS